jgi:hypothetical protein
MHLADLHRAVESTLNGKRLGTPVFARYLIRTQDKAGAVAARLAQITATVRDWLGQAPERIYALGSAKAGQVSLTLEFRGGATALIAWASAAAHPGVDVTVVGNHGALYHDAGAGHSWDDSLSLPQAKPDEILLAWVERALRSERPEGAA